jgi:hypothetical protein
MHLAMVHEQAALNKGIDKSSSLEESLDQRTNKRDVVQRLKVRQRSSTDAARI